MNLVTTGDIAQRLKVDRDAVSYALRRGKIQPVGRAGIVRLFSEGVVETVKNYLDSKQQRKQLIKARQRETDGR